jgi:hypothetical protein
MRLRAELFAFELPPLETRLDVPAVQLKNVINPDEWVKWPICLYLQMFFASSKRCVEGIPLKHRQT